MSILYCTPVPLSTSVSHSPSVQFRSRPLVQVLGRLLPRYLFSHGYSFLPNRRVLSSSVLSGFSGPCPLPFVLLRPSSSVLYRNFGPHYSESGTSSTTSEDLGVWSKHCPILRADFLILGVRISDPVFDPLLHPRFVSTRRRRGTKR